MHRVHALSPDVSVATPVDSKTLEQLEELTGDRLLAGVVLRASAFVAGASLVDVAAHVELAADWGNLRAISWQSEPHQLPLATEIGLGTAALRLTNAANAAPVTAA